MGQGCNFNRPRHVRPPCPADRPAYRPDIEGLRGIAILLVVLFHAGVSAFRGGFVGVDVFFVLSGFFITGMLVRELDANGGVDVNAFYTRRALRLLPALLVTLLVTLGAVFWLYAPIDRAGIAGDARAVALYAGTSASRDGAVDYFSAGDNPLLHTWSLAVEEQFYLVWPLLFLGLAMFGLARTAERRAPLRRDRHRGRAGLVRRLAVADGRGAAVGVLRHAHAHLGVRARRLARAGDERPHRRAQRDVARAAVGGPRHDRVRRATYDRATPYPGGGGALPALGTCFLLLGGNRAGDEPGEPRCLAYVADVARRVSYAWYLWHWPLVGLGAVLDPGIGVWGRLAWSAAALVLAWLTWRFVERPVRNGNDRVEPRAVALAAPWQPWRPASSSRSRRTAR